MCLCVCVFVSCPAFYANHSSNTGGGGICCAEVAEASLLALTNAKWEENQTRWNGERERGKADTHQAGNFDLLFNVHN